MRIVLQRHWQNRDQTEGDIQILDNRLRVLLKGSVIELPDRGNQKRISRIPSGDYKVRRRWSQKFGYHLEVLNVENRSYILLHSGNYFTQTEGCILVGFSLRDINKDFNVDTINSRKFLNEMLHVLPKEGLIDLKIVDDIGVDL